MNATSRTSSGLTGLRGLGIALAVFAVVLLGLFSRSFNPSLALFSNDGPLGLNQADFMSMPEGFAGIWQDLNWLGSYGASALPTFTYCLLWVLKPLGFAKFYGPACLLILALSAYLFFRASALPRPVAILGGVAAMLNTDFFSYTCWGLGTHALAVAGTFLALAALALPRPGAGWSKAVLAGLAVGISVMEGFDSGAILSLYVAVFTVFQAWQEGGIDSRRLVLGGGRLVVVAVVAAWMAYAALQGLIGSQIVGIVGMGQDAESRARRWNEATQWSLPRTEVLRLVVPGLYGYRLDSPEGGNYWGAVGRDAAWEAYLKSPRPDPAQQPRNPGGLRHSGAGFYTGVSVVLLALWALLEAARGAASAHDRKTRRWIWFWGGVALISLLLALGRHAPFYQFFYALPYFSTIRNPIKFLHPYSIAMVVLCGYGLHGLWLRLQQPREGSRRGGSAWWRSASGFERRVVQGAALVLGAALVSWLIYVAASSDLVRHLARVGFPNEGGFASAMARFSQREVGWSILFLAATLGGVVLCVAGRLAGSRSSWAAAWFSVVIVGDLGRASLPWIQYYDYRKEYASNPIVDQLREHAHQQRVTGLFLGVGPEAARMQEEFQQLYYLHWMQRLFPYYNVQCLDIIQMPRTDTETYEYQQAMAGARLREWEPGLQGSDLAVRALQLSIRRWELTSTRHLVGLAGFVVPLNQDQSLDAGRGRFALRSGFELRPAPVGGGSEVVTDAQGPLGFIEFSGALPKAQLYTRWEVMTNGTECLKRLTATSFDPGQSVLLNQPWSAPGWSPALTNAPVVAAFEHYEPRRVRLTVDTPTAGILLLNDKYHPLWTVTVDGAPAELLRCNYVMRGVPVPAGRHQVEFRFRVPMQPFYISLACVAVGLIFGAWLLWTGIRPGGTPPSMTDAPA